MIGTIYGKNNGRVQGGESWQIGKKSRLIVNRIAIVAAALCCHERLLVLKKVAGDGSRGTEKRVVAWYL
jgi:hypothetical protein